MCVTNVDDTTPWIQHCNLFCGLKLWSTRKLPCNLCPHFTFCVWEICNTKNNVEWDKISFICQNYFIISHNFQVGSKTLPHETPRSTPCRMFSDLIFPVLAQAVRKHNMNQSNQTLEPFNHQHTAHISLHLHRPVKTDNKSPNYEICKIWPPTFLPNWGYDMYRIPLFKRPHPPN